MNGTNLHIAVLMLAVILAVAIGWAYFAATDAQGRLTVTTNPPDAIVFIDGRSLGATPLDEDGVSLGLRRLVISKDGYEPYTRILHFNPKDTIEVDIYLSSEDFLAEKIYSVNDTTTLGLFITDAHILLPSARGKIAAFALESLDLSWEHDLVNEMITTHPILLEELLVVTTFDANLYALSLADGSIVGTESLPSRAQRLLATDNGLIAFLQNGRVLQLSAKLEVEWELQLPSKRAPLILQAERDNYTVLTREGSLVSLSPTDGQSQVLGALETGEITRAVAGPQTLFTVDNRGRGQLWDRDQLTAKSSSIEGIAYVERTDTGYLVGDRDGLLFVINDQTGKREWEVELHSPATVSHSYGNVLLLGCQDGSVFVLEPSQGRVIIRKELIGAITSIRDNGEKLLASTRSGAVFKLSLPDY